MCAKVQTVLGNVSPGVLGKTLTHEHLVMDFTHFYSHPPEQLSFAFKNKIKLNELGYLRQYPHSSPYNLVLHDSDSRIALLNDVRNYKKFGGGTIVENTTEGLKRDLEFMKTVSKDTAVHIIAGTGFYIADMQDKTVLRCNKEQMYNHMLEELTVGCIDNRSVKAGFMGEIASVWPIKDFERTAIQATGALQEQLGCGVSFHPGRDPDAPFEIIRLYLEAGGKANKAVMSHLDRTIFEDERLLEFAKLGTYCQLDLFGVEVSYYQLQTATDMPSDAQRLDKIKTLIEEGYEDKILMSHDIHTKHRLTDFGGHGYSHIINNILPKMKTKGISEEVIDKITTKNPAEWLAF